MREEQENAEKNLSCSTSVTPGQEQDNSKKDLSYKACVQCGKCSAGCPVAFESEHTPRNIIRLLQLGRWKEACESPFLWVCAGCYTCTVRCPRGVQIAEEMLALRRMSFEKNWVMPGEKLIFHKNFLEMIKKKKRISELSLGLAVGLRTFPPTHLVEDVMLLLKLLRRGKLK